MVHLIFDIQGISLYDLHQNRECNVVEQNFADSAISCINIERGNSSQIMVSHFLRKFWLLYHQITKCFDYFVMSELPTITIYNMTQFYWYSHCNLTHYHKHQWFSLYVLVRIAVFGLYLSPNIDPIHSRFVFS